MAEASSSRLVGGGVDGGARVWRVLRCAPGLVPFQERARLFQGEVFMDRQVWSVMSRSSEPLFVRTKCVYTCMHVR